jgi:hypothetical protein
MTKGKTDQQYMLMRSMIRAMRTQLKYFKDSLGISNTTLTLTLPMTPDLRRQCEADLAIYGLSLSRNRPFDFDQKLVIKIKRIRNAFSVYMDPNAQEPDYSDAKFGFIFSYYSRDEYKNQFGDSELASIDDWQGIGDRAPGWIEGKKTVRIAEYFCKRTKKVTLCQYADGSVEIKGEEADDRQDPPTAEKEVEVPCVYWYKLNGIEILDKRDWPGQWIPIIPVLGDELDVDGKRILEGMVRHTKDSIRMSNYMASAQVETIVQPNPPWIAPAGSIERFEKEWRNAGTAATTVLRYDPLPVGNTVARPPERNTAEPAIVAISQARAAFVEDLKAITGIYDAQLGQKSNEISGKAINSRKEQGQVANFHYIDNLTRAIRHTGRILLDLIPQDLRYTPSPPHYWRRWGSKDRQSQPALRCKWRPEDI